MERGRFRVFMNSTFPPTPFASLSSFDDEDPQLLNTVIEAPKGSRSKFDFDPERGLFYLGGVLPAGAVYGLATLSTVRLNDFTLIEELRATVPGAPRLEMLDKLGKESARLLRGKARGHAFRSQEDHRAHPRTTLPGGDLARWQALRRQLAAVVLLPGRGRTPA